MANERDVKYFCVGLGLGVAAAFLWAPRPGADLRKQIQDKANEGVGYLKKQAGSAATRAADALDRGARTVRHQKENVLAAVEAGNQAYRRAAASNPSV